MTDAVFDFKSIRRKLERQEQKAEFEAKNPVEPEPSMYGWPYGVVVPFDGVRTGGTSVSTSGICEHLPPYIPTGAADRNGPVSGGAPLGSVQSPKPKIIDWNAPPTFLGVKI